VAGVWAVIACLPMLAKSWGSVFKTSGLVRDRVTNPYSLPGHTNPTAITYDKESCYNAASSCASKHDPSLTIKNRPRTTKFVAVCTYFRS
jgi:hypothetical protein